jgi:hypothetical protein
VATWGAVPHRLKPKAFGFSAKSYSFIASSLTIPKSLKAIDSNNLSVSPKKITLGLSGSFGKD